MNPEIDEINNDFEDIKSMRIKIKETFDVFELKIKFLKDVYLKYINENENKKLLFGLDSLHFQNTLIDFEYNNLKQLYHLIDNKIYCEYYKLLKIINNYVLTNERLNKLFNSTIINNKYPAYKDLEPFKIYEFNLINNIHDNIINILNDVLNYCKNELNNLSREKHKKNSGLKLDNYINTIEYDILIIKQNINLHINYLKVFHNYHITYLSRLNIRINIIWGQVSSDIKLNSFNDFNNTIEENKSRDSCPSPLSNKEHNEILEIMKENDIPKVKSELENIMSCNSLSSNEDGYNVNDNNIYMKISNTNIDTNNNQIINEKYINKSEELLQNPYELEHDIIENENISNSEDICLSMFDI